MPGYEGVALIVDRLDGITGINLRAAQVIVAECGIEMERFASDKQFASWLGVCPNNEVSAPVIFSNDRVPYRFPRAGHPHGKRKEG